MNNFTVLPELIIVNFLLDILEYLKNDIETNISTPEKSYIYQIFKPKGEIKNLNRYNYYDQAKAILTREVDHPKVIKIHTELDYNKDNVPYFIVAELVDAVHERNLGISQNMYVEQNEDYEGETTFSEIRMAQFAIIVCTENTDESSLLYNLIKNAILTFLPELQFMGLMEAELKSNHKEKIPNTAPDNFFRRELILEFIYQFNSPTLEQYPQWTNYNFVGKMINE